MCDTRETATQLFNYLANYGGRWNDECNYYLYFWVGILEHGAIVNFFEYDSDWYEKISINLGEFIGLINQYFHAEDELTSEQIAKITQIWNRYHKHDLAGFKLFFKKVLQENIIPDADLKFIVNSLKVKFNKIWKDLSKRKEIKMNAIKVEREGLTLPSKYDTTYASIPDLEFASEPVVDVLEETINKGRERRKVEEGYMRQSEEDQMEPMRQVEEDRLKSISEKTEQDLLDEIINGKPNEIKNTWNYEQMKKDEIDKERMQALMAPLDRRIIKGGKRKTIKRKTIKY